MSPPTVAVFMNGWLLLTSGSSQSWYIEEILTMPQQSSRCIPGQAARLSGPSVYMTVSGRLVVFCPSLDGGPPVVVKWYQILQGM